MCKPRIICGSTNREKSQSCVGGYWPSCHHSSWSTKARWKRTLNTAPSVNSYYRPRITPKLSQWRPVTYNFNSICPPYVMRQGEPDRIAGYWCSAQVATTNHLPLFVPGVCDHTSHRTKDANFLTDKMEGTLSLFFLLYYYFAIDLDFVFLLSHIQFHVWRYFGGEMIRPSQRRPDCSRLSFELPFYMALIHTYNS